jgi:hypothetical protein
MQKTFYARGREEEENLPAKVARAPAITFLFTQNKTTHFYRFAAQQG